MPDGSQAALPLVVQTREPSLAGALDALFACAEQGLHPDAVLRDIRALLGSRGLLLQDGLVAQHHPLTAAPASAETDLPIARQHLTPSPG